MKIDISPILKQKGMKLHLSGEEPFQFKEPKFLDDIKVEFTLTNIGKSILVEGEVNGTLSLSCGFCLLDFPLPFHVTFSEEYFPKTAQGLKDANAPPDDIFTYDKNNVLDVSEAVRQAVIVELPMRPVCKPGCKGLCPTCGKNKNEGDCCCHAETSDERWAPLKRRIF